MRYQTIDTKSGEIVRETAVHPMLGPLASKPRKQPRASRTQANSANDPAFFLAVIAALTALIAVAL
jgi:hypothetical protein